MTDDSEIEYRKKEYQQKGNPKTSELAQLIIQRWKEVDEEGFLESEFASWEKVK